MIIPQVYIDGEGITRATFCDLSRLVIKGRVTPHERCCSAINCVCTSDSEVFRKATQEQAIAFWTDMRRLADAAMAEARF